MKIGPELKSLSAEGWVEASRWQGEGGGVEVHLVGRLRVGVELEASESPERCTFSRAFTSTNSQLQSFVNTEDEANPINC